MKTFSLLFASLLTLAASTNAQITNWAHDGSFEDVPKSDLYKPDAKDTNWALSGDALFVSNAKQPAGYKTPYGKQYLYYAYSQANPAKSSAPTTGSASQTIYVGDEPTNTTLSYYYHVFANNASVCQFQATYVDQVIDFFTLPTSTSSWVNRVAHFVPVATPSGAFELSLLCRPSVEATTFQLGVDNVALINDGCPLCG